MSAPKIPAGTTPAASAGAATAGAPDPAAVDRPVRPAPSPEVALARQELLAARAGLAMELDTLNAATKASLDIPAKVRRDPVKAAALAGGAGFLLLGGPKRVLRRVGRVLPGRKPDRYAGLLPDEVEKVLRRTGVAKDPRVREALERDFAEYLRRKGRTDVQPNAKTSLWRTYDTLVGPLGTVGARMLVERLLAADGTWNRRGGSDAERPAAPGDKGPRPETPGQDRG